MPLLYAHEDVDWETWFSGARINEMPRVKHYMGNDFTTIEMAAHGFGVAMGDDMTCRYYLDRGILVRPFRESKKSSRAFYLIERNKPSRNIATRTVKEWILSNFNTGPGAEDPAS